VPPAVADRYALELHALAASLATPAGDDGPARLTLDQAAGELLLGFERDLEPRLAAGSGDLAHLAGWAAKLAGATCRLAGLLHLAGHLRDGWARPIDGDTFAGAARLAGYLVDHALAVFDLMGADPRVDDARWLLDWISRTGQAHFSRRDAHQAARGRFRKAADLEPPWPCWRSTSGCVASTPTRSAPRAADPPHRFLVNPLHPDSEPSQPSKPHPQTGSEGCEGSEARVDTSGGRS
jgi:replicative DNA helicase